MRTFLAGCLMSGICLSSFGGQGNNALVNTGEMRNESRTEIHNHGIPLNEHWKVRDALIRMGVEAERREAELAAKTKLTVQQKRELADLRAQLASVERDNRSLQAKYESDLKKALTPSSIETSVPKIESVAIAIPAAERAIFDLMERSEAERVGLSQALAKAPDRLEPILKSLIATTESMDDRDRTGWYGLLPQMTLEQRLRLFDILSTERRKLADLERQYQSEIADLNTKHLDEWVAFQRNHLDKNDPAAVRTFAASLINGAQAKFLSEAEGLLLKLVRSDAGDAEAHYQLGRLYVVREQWQDAQDAVAAAIRLAPDKAAYHGLSGNIFLREDKRDKALEAYARAYQLETPDPALLRSYGALLLDAKRYPEAEVVLRRFVYLAPKNAEAFRLLGLVLRDQDRFAEAEGYLKQAVDRDGKNPRNRLALAWVYYQQRQYAEAESAFHFAANLNPEDVDAMTMVGLSRAEQGRRKDALPTLRAALQQAVGRKVSKADEAEIRLGVALLLSDDGKVDEGKALMADAAANSQGCSTSYMKTRRNWHGEMLRLLGEWRGALCGG